jgi:hypothetical protein
MPLHRVVVVTGAVRLITCRVGITRNDNDLVRMRILGVMMAASAVWIGRAEVRSREREQPVDYESGERQDR